MRALIEISDGESRGCRGAVWVSSRSRDRRPAVLSLPGLTHAGSDTTRSPPPPHVQHSMYICPSIYRSMYYINLYRVHRLYRGSISHIRAFIRYTCTLPRSDKIRCKQTSNAPRACLCPLNYNRMPLILIDLIYAILENS